MNVTLSEFVVKSLIEKRSVDLLYVDAKYLANFLTELKLSAKNYGVDAQLKAVIKDGTAMKFIKLYDEMCEIVAGFGIAAPSEAEAMARLNLEKLANAKDGRAHTMPTKYLETHASSAMHH